MTENDKAEICDPDPPDAVCLGSTYHIVAGERHKRIGRNPRTDQIPEFHLLEGQICARVAGGLGELQENCRRLGWSHAIGTPRALDFRLLVARLQPADGCD